MNRATLTSLLAIVAVTVSIVGGERTLAGLADLTSTVGGQGKVETVVFSDDFDDNANGWSNIGVINGVGTPAISVAAIGADPLGSGESAWFPSTNVAGNVLSVAIIPSPIDIVAESAFSIYFRARIETDHINSRFGVKVSEKDNLGNFTSLSLLHQLYYRAVSGSTVSIFISGINVIDVGDGFKNFRLTITDVGETGHPGTNGMTLVGSVYNTSTMEWDPFVTSSADSRYSSTGANMGVFESFELNSRNAGTAHRAVFDAFAITTLSDSPAGTVLSIK